LFTSTLKNLPTGLHVSMNMDSISYVNENRKEPVYTCLWIWIPSVMLMKTEKKSIIWSATISLYLLKKKFL